MLRFVRTMPKNEAAKCVEGWLSECFSNSDGVCYYRHPAVVTETDEIPDFIVFTKTTQPLVVRIVENQLSDIKMVEEDMWEIDDTTVDSPLLVHEDLVVMLENQFQDQRKLRNRLHTQGVLALPFITKSDFEQRFGALSGSTSIIWKDGNTSVLQHRLERELSDEEWTLTRSVIQGSTHLHKPSPVITRGAATLGSAIRDLDRHVVALDDEQEKVALEIPSGPQRIRGLAGTGKTVLLAMRAAHIHLLYPEKKILFTFNTWSLYKTVLDIITETHRAHKGTDPNWDVLHLRHALGRSNHPGVYSDLCAYQGVKSLDLRTAKNIDKQKDSLQLYYEHAFQALIIPEYDFILVDEAQDFPKEFFRVLYQLSEDPKRIYWACDEWQNLSSLEMPKPEELFGVDKQGIPFVSLEGEPYEGPIAKDFVLQRSYRCPLEVLMLAHAIGLGIHNPDGPVQMLEDQAYWEAIGYEVESGKLQEGEQVVIFRDVKNSPNPISNLYNKQPLITLNVFQTREAELDWIADSIKKDLQEEDVLPHQILVLLFVKYNTEQNITNLQNRLFQDDIVSTMPSPIEDTISLARTGCVTLSALSKAKGNEAHIVYILGFESLYDYIKGVDDRNLAFTSITRSKAWVRITGLGKQMEDARAEIYKILADLPRFKFTFPDMKKLHYTKSNYERRQVLALADQAVVNMNKTAIEALVALITKKPGSREDLEALKRRISEVLGENR